MGTVWLLYQVSTDEHPQCEGCWLGGAKRRCHKDPECLSKCLMWHEWEAIRGQARWGWRVTVRGPLHVSSSAQRRDSKQHTDTVIRKREQNGDFTWKSLCVVVSVGTQKLKMLKSSNITSGASWIGDGEHEKEAGISVRACACLCVMWKTNEHCIVGYWPYAALLFLRANPAASPPLPPPPQPPQKLYNGELLSLCYLTPTTHYALPASWETEEWGERESEEKVGWFLMKKGNIICDFSCFIFRL